MNNKFTFGLVMVFGLLATLAYFIRFTVESGSMVGSYILGIISALLIGLMFWSMQLVSTWLHSAWEQQRFRDNANENYGNLLAQQKIQNEQTKGALMLSNNALKHTPQDEENYLVFDESAFDNIEE